MILQVLPDGGHEVRRDRNITDASIRLEIANRRLAVDPRHTARHPYFGMAQVKITTSQLGQLTETQRAPGLQARSLTGIAQMINSSCGSVAGSIRCLRVVPDALRMWHGLAGSFSERGRRQLGYSPGDYFRPAR
jgi:hypothetical protein